MYLPHVVVLTHPLQKGAGKKIVGQRRQATRSLWCLGAILERWMGCEGTTQKLTSTETLQHWSLHLTKGVFFKEPECHSPTPCDHITPSPVQDMVRSSSSWSRSPNTHCRGNRIVYTNRLCGGSSTSWSGCEDSYTNPWGCHVVLYCSSSYYTTSMDSGFSSCSTSGPPELLWSVSELCSRAALQHHLLLAAPQVLTTGSWTPGPKPCPLRPCDTQDQGQSHQSYV